MVGSPRALAADLITQRLMKYALTTMPPFGREGEKANRLLDRKGGFEYLWGSLGTMGIEKLDMPQVLGP